MFIRFNIASKIHQTSCLFVFFPIKWATLWQSSVTKVAFVLLRHFVCQLHRIPLIPIWFGGAACLWDLLRWKMCAYLVVEGPSFRGRTFSLLLGCQFLFCHSYVKCVHFQVIFQGTSALHPHSKNRASPPHPTNVVMFLSWFWLVEQASINCGENPQLCAIEMDLRLTSRSCCHLYNCDFFKACVWGLRVVLEKHFLLEWDSEEPPRAAAKALSTLLIQPTGKPLGLICGACPTL